MTVLAARRRTPEALQQLAQVGPIVAMAMLVNTAFLRDPLNTRLPDAVVPAAVLGAWLLARAWRSTHARGLAIAAGAILWDHFVGVVYSAPEGWMPFLSPALWPWWIGATQKSHV